MCTNGYADDLWPGVRRSVIAPNSYQIATEPLSDNIRKSILPFGQVSSDARKLLLYFRLDDRGRLLLGGRGPFREPRDAGDWAASRSDAAAAVPAGCGCARSTTAGAAALRSRAISCPICTSPRRDC